MLSLVASPTRTGKGSLRVNLRKNVSIGLEMTEMSANFRLGILIKEFGMIFGGFLLEKGKGSLGLGMRPNSCRVQVGAVKAMALMS